MFNHCKFVWVPLLLQNRSHFIWSYISTIEWANIFVKIKWYLKSVTSCIINLMLAEIVLHIFGRKPFKGFSWIIFSVVKFKIEIYLHAATNTYNTHVTFANISRLLIQNYIYKITIWVIFISALLYTYYTFFSIKDTLKKIIIKNHNTGEVTAH